MESFELETYITKAKNGDKESIYILIEYFAPYIYKIIKNYHINGNEISDLYQVSCIAIMKAIQKYNSNSNTFKSYVYRAIFNEVCYLARSNKKYNNCVSYHALINDSENEFSEILLQDKMSIEQFIHDENIDALYKYIAELDEDDLHLVNHVYFNNMSFTDYSNKFNIPYNQVIRRKNHILENLRRKIKQAED